jgi:hypothetical protein
MRPEEPLDLSALRTEVPLRDADYAAIRARVRAEIARREERRWWPLFVRFAFAAVMIVVLAMLVVPRKEETKVAPQVVKHVPAPVTTAYAPAPLPAAPDSSSEFLGVPRRERSLPHKTRGTRGTPRNPEEPKQIAQSPEPMRIELQTADPDVRIIWIVQPEQAKENS